MARPLSGHIVSSPVNKEVKPPSQPHPRPGKICWFYGRSGSGKTTLAMMLSEKLKKRGYPVFVVDGDSLRSGLCRDLGFDETSRTENHRRAAELARLAVEQGFVVIGATMCPLQAHRSLLRAVLGERLHLVYLEATHEECAARDPKGLYRKFAAGKLEHFEKDFFQEPLTSESDMTIPTGARSPVECAGEIDFMEEVAVAS